MLLSASSAVQADLIASVDRDQVSMGDTLRLTITATGNEPINNINLRPLLAEFEVLRRTSSSTSNIINGRLTSTRQVILDIMPKKEGTLKIPSLRAGPYKTNYLFVAVNPAPNSIAAGQRVSFTAELDRDSVYVQGQVILTLRILQSINLESRSVTELQLDHAFVKELEQKSFQRTIDGRPWIVHEIRYAVFPEESGLLEIPAQTFSARESTPRRSMLDFGGSGRQMKRTTEALSIRVLPRPDNFPSTTWLPARKLEIRETWSTPPEQLRTGESATRTVTIIGEGLQGAQLPPTLFPATEGLKYYPDQAAINETEVTSGLLGSRVDSAALIPTRTGSWTMSEIRIPWWDTESEQVRYAILPERQITVAAGSSVQLDSTPITIVRQLDGSELTAPSVTVDATTTTVWKAAALISALGWLATLAYLWVSRRKPATQAPSQAAQTSETQAFKQLIAACTTDNPAVARRAVITWTDSLQMQGAVHSLDEVVRYFNDPQLDTTLDTLDAQLYGAAVERWSGDELSQTIRRLRKKHNSDRGEHEDESLALYPS